MTKTFFLLKREQKMRDIICSYIDSYIDNYWILAARARQTFQAHWHTKAGAARPPRPVDNALDCKAAIFSYIAKEFTRDQLRVPLRMYSIHIIRYTYNTIIY